MCWGGGGGGGRRPGKVRLMKRDPLLVFIGGMM